MYCNCTLTSHEACIKVHDNNNKLVSSKYTNQCKNKNNKQVCSYKIIDGKKLDERTMECSQFSCPYTGARSLDVIFILLLILDKQINSVVNSSFFHVRSVAQKKKKLAFLAFEPLEAVLHAFISSHLFLCGTQSVIPVLPAACSNCSSENPHWYQEEGPLHQPPLTDILSETKN